MRNTPHARRNPRHGDHRIHERETRPPSWPAARLGAGLTSTDGICAAADVTPGMDHGRSRGQTRPYDILTISQYCCIIYRVEPRKGRLMEFSVEFYETAGGQAVVEDEIETIEKQSPILHALLVTGLNKLNAKSGSVFGVILSG
jgi:hypothetical protein